MSAYVIWFKDINMSMIDTVGGKNASLGEMINNLTKKGINVPNGFAVTTNAYKEYVKYNNLHSKVNHILETIDTTNIEDLRRKALSIRTLFSNSKFPSEVEKEITTAYKILSSQYKDVDGNPQEATDVAVRSSGTAEDLPDASFAGQQDTYLNTRGDLQLLVSIRNCFASLYTDRAIVYRRHNKFPEEKVLMSVGIQKMARSDLGSSGVAMSIDTESGFKDVIIINGTFGLGELVVQGSITPDEFIVFKPTLHEGFNSIIDVKLGNKTHKMIYGNSAEDKVMIVPLSKTLQNKWCMDKDNIIKLSKWVCVIEEYYTSIRGTYTPMDVEWAYDGLEKKLYVVQARPETVKSKQDTTKMIEYKLELNKSNKPIISGTAVGDLVSHGKVHIIMSLDKRHTTSNPDDFKKGDILVTDMTDPDWEPLMKLSSGIITNKGGRTCHSAIIARELGIPCIVGTENATEMLKNKELVTVSCAEGEKGNIYSGKIPYNTIITDLSSLPKSPVPLMLNVGSPEKVFKLACLPHAGVGLAREEFIINNFIGMHPLALMNYPELSVEMKKIIDSKIRGYKTPIDYYVDKLSYGIARIGAAFYPNDVIVRFSDFKSNEYRKLLGGDLYEPHEENPMIGWRGASRYYSNAFKKAFGLECLAIKHVREKLGLKNVIVMVPFCRTPEEMQKVLDVMKEYGLERGKDGLKVYIMCEIPANVILAEEFCKYVDGFSIGSNDLTQLTLGLDRDSHLVSHIYDERSAAVKKMISMAIETAQKHGKKIGICGQGPSDFPDFAKFLVEKGIDTISVVPDSFVKTIKVLTS